MAGRMMALMLALLAFLTCGCTKTPNEPDIKDPVQFYYKVSGERYGSTDSAIDHELYDAQGHVTDYSKILEVYLQGPKTAGLVAPFPKATKLRSARLDGDTLRIELSDDFGVLSGIDLTMACSCITMTCLQFPGVKTVSIRSQRTLLDGRPAITMAEDLLILEDSGAYSTASSYLLYFSDTDNRYLIAEELQLDLPPEELPRYLLDRLILGPEGAGLAQTVPLNTTIRDLGITEGVCNVDLSGEFLRNSPKTELAQRMTILSLTNTMTQLDGIESLLLYVDGERLTQYGAMDLREPLTFELGAVGPARISLNEIDTDLYLYAGDSTSLSRVPTRVRQSADKLAAEQILDALLSRVDQNGYRSFIPEGTGLVDVYLENSVCVMVFTPELLQAGSSLNQAAQVICASVLASDVYDAVEIRIDGLSSEELPEPLGQSVVWNPDWTAAYNQP